MIVIERVQGGFAGQTAERTSIGEDGCFTVDRLLNGRVISRLRAGQLDADRLAGAREAIAAADFASLPERAGSPPVVNAASLSVTYEGTTKAAALPPAGSRSDVRAPDQDPAAPSARLARLAARLVELAGS